MRITTFISLLGTLLLLLTACGRSPSAPTESEALLLAEDKPTFLFFFTDN
jgi:hypothetical protein